MKIMLQYYIYYENIFHKYTVLIAFVVKILHCSHEAVVFC